MNLLKYIIPALVLNKVYKKKSAHKKIAAATDKEADAILDSEDDM